MDNLVKDSRLVLPDKSFVYSILGLTIEHT